MGWGHSKILIEIQCFFPQYLDQFLFSLRCSPHLENILSRGTEDADTQKCFGQVKKVGESMFVVKPTG